MIKLLACILIFVAVLGATTVFGSLVPTVDAYYVDSVNGNDANAGTYSAPFKTIAHLISVDAGANKSRWRLVTGSHFREQLTVPRENMTIDAYGAGSRPLLDGAVPVAAASWSKTGGQTFVYQASGLVIDQTDQFVRAWANAAGLLRATSIADCDGTAGSYFPSTEASSPITLYVHLSDNSNPGGKPDGYIEYNKISQPLKATQDYVTIIGVETTRQLANNGSLETGKYATIINVKASDGHKHCVLLGPGVRVFGLEISDGYYASQQTSPLVVFGTFNGESTIMNDLVIYPGNLNASLGSAIYSHCQVGCSQGPIYITNATITGMNTATAFEDSAVAGVYIVGGTFGTTLSPLVNAFSGNNSTFNYTISGVSAYTTRTTMGLPRGTQTISNSTFHAGAGWNAIDGYAANGVTLNIQNSVVIGGHGIDINASGIRLVSLHNDFTGVTDYNYVLGNTYVSINSDYSAFGTAHFALEDPFTDYTLTQWRTATGQDTHSTP